MSSTLMRKNLFGHNQQSDELLHIANRTNSESNEIVYYFGGDIQDWPERMSLSRENRRFQQWNLVTTGEILARRFPQASIVIFRPTEVKDGGFSRFSNFVPKTSESGDPLVYDTNGYIGLRHLQVLDRQLSEPPALITLIGFSKGCVVLNQILHELTDLSRSKEQSDLILFSSRIRTFFWLDGGHNNGSKTMIWPIDDALIVTLENARIQTEVFVTPFQIDPNNPYKIYHWSHYKKFSELLNNHSLGHNRMLFNDQKPSIEKHFEVLRNF